MARKFNTVQDVQRAFKVRSNGSDSIQGHAGVRYSDIEKHSHIIERLLNTDYNQISGFTFTELMEAVSLVASNYNSAEYANAYRQDKRAIGVSESLASTDSEYYSMNEAFEGTTISQAPFPVPAVSLVTYQYEKSVIPFLCHQFDLHGNRGLVYYQNIKATNAKGNVAAGDLLGSPKEMGKQNVGFVGTRVIGETIETTTSGTQAYTATLANVPQPGSLVITIEGKDGYFMDFATADARKTGAVDMLSVNGNLGNATIDYANKTVTIALAEAPTADLAIKATYNRDIEETAANIAKVDVQLESKQLVAENFSVFTETNLYQEALSRAVFGLEWNTIVDDALAALYNKEIANKITSEIKEKLIPANIATHDISKGIVGGSGVTALGGNNALFNTQFIAVVLGKLRALIQAASGLSFTRVSAIAISIDVLPIMEALPKFVGATNMMEDTMGGMVLVGMYDGIPVVVGYDPILTSGEVLGIYKSQTKDFLTPYVFGTFVLPVIRDIFDQDNLATNRKQLIASAAGEVVAERLAAKITITGISEII